MVSLDGETLSLADQLAREAGTSRSELLRQLIQQAGERSIRSVKTPPTPSLRTLTAKRQTIINKIRSLLKEADEEAVQQVREAYRKLGGITPKKLEDFPKCDQAMARLAQEYGKFNLTPQEIAFYATLYDLTKQLVETDEKILETLKKRRQS